MSFDLQGLATLAMVGATFIIIVVTRYHNIQVDKHNVQTLELMKKTYEPTLSLDLCKFYESSHEGTFPQYRIIIRNDGNGPAKNVKLCYRFYIEQYKPGETSWVESEKDLEQGGPVVQIGSIAPGRELKRRVNKTRNAYAVCLEASCEDVLGKSHECCCEKVYFDDAETC